MDCCASTSPRVWYCATTAGDNVRLIAYSSTEQGTAELLLQLAFAPALLRRPAKVELACLRAPGRLKNDEVVGSRQKSHQW